MLHNKCSFFVNFFYLPGKWDIQYIVLHQQVVLEKEFIFLEKDNVTSSSDDVSRALVWALEIHFGTANIFSFFAYSKIFAQSV